MLFIYLANRSDTYFHGPGHISYIDEYIALHYLLMWCYDHRLTNILIPFHIVSYFFYYFFYACIPITYAFQYNIYIVFCIFIVCCVYISLFGNTLYSILVFTLDFVCLQYYIWSSLLYVNLFVYISLYGHMYLFYSPCR